MTKKKNDSNGGVSDDKSKITFFGRRSHSKGMPGWYFKRRIEEMEEEMRDLEVGIKYADPDRRQQMQNDYVRLKENYEELMEERPKLNGGQLKRVGKCYNELSKIIQGTLFTESEMKMATVDPAEELRRSKARVLEFPREFADIAEASGLDLPNDRKCSRDQMTKVWKLCGSLQNAPTNIEYLRKDRKTGAYKSEHELYTEFAEKMREEFYDPEYIEWKKKREK